MKTLAPRAVAVTCALLAMSVPALGQDYLGSVEAPEGTGKGIWLGHVNISPFLNLSALYDSNVDFVREGEEDEFPDKDTRGYSVQPGIDLSLPGVDWGLDGRAYYQRENYRADFAETRDDWSELLTFYAESDSGLTFRLSELFQHVSHTDLSSEDRWNDRDEARLTADVGGPVTERTALNVSGNYSLLSYDDDDLYDWTRYGGGLTGSYKMTDKTDALLSTTFDINESDGSDGTAESLRLMAGMASRATEKTSYRAAAGVEHYGGFDGEDSELGLTYNLGASWRGTERLTLTLFGDSRYTPAEDVENNSMLRSTLGVGAVYRLFTRWELVLNGLYRREDYNNPVQVTSEVDILDAEGDPDGESRTDNQLSAQTRVVYGLNNYASLFAGFVYSHLFSTVEEFDYDRWRADIGASLRY